MFKTWTIAIGFFICANLMAQKPVVSVNPNNVAYYGYDNKISIQYPNFKSHLSLISTDSLCCPLKQIEGEYYLRPSLCQSIRHCKLLVKKKSKTIDTIQIKVKSISPTRISLGDVQGYISKEELLKADSIILVSEPTYDMVYDQRILKFRMIGMPKNGNMWEILSLRNTFDSTVKRLFKSLNPGDIIVIDGIRAVSNLWKGEKPLNPLVITISKASADLHHRSTRVTGYIKSNNTLIPYLYPKHEGDELSIQSNKDSIWKYYFYHFELDSFLLHFSYQYKNNEIIKKTFYINDSITSYIDETIINDSMMQYEQYYTNGKLYQKGIVKINTPYSKNRKYKFSNETIKHNKPIYKKALEDMIGDCVPMGYWQIYDSTGYLKSTVNWELVLEPNYGLIDETDPDEPILTPFKDYYCKPKGEVVIYNANGDIIERLFPED